MPYFAPILWPLTSKSEVGHALNKLLHVLYTVYRCKYCLLAGIQRHKVATFSGEKDEWEDSQRADYSVLCSLGSYVLLNVSKTDLAHTNTASSDSGCIGQNSSDHCSV